MRVYILQEVSRGHSIRLVYKHRRRSESFNLRSSEFKICFMAQQQEITYQYDLFSQTGAEVIRPFVNSEAVSGAVSTTALQVKEAGEQTRALAADLMGVILCHSNIKRAYKQVKQNKGVAGIDQMAVGEFAAWYAENVRYPDKQAKPRQLPATRGKTGRNTQAERWQTQAGYSYGNRQDNPTSNCTVVKSNLRTEIFRPQLRFSSESKCPSGIKEVV